MSLRVLHVVGDLSAAGIETWLMHVLRGIDRDRFRLDFLVHTERAAAHDEEARALGAKIHRCPDMRRPWLYGPRFRRVVEENGPFDAVHSHLHHFSGIVLRLARRAGIGVRIAHSHNDLRSVHARAGLARKLYLRLTEHWIREHATVGLAASADAAASLFGEGWRSDPRWRILRCAVDLAPFAKPVVPRRVRAELDLPEDAFVIGHVGRFVDQKNHAFLVEVAAEVMRREPGAHLLLVGEGVLLGAIRERCERLGIAGRVRFAGVRLDVPRLLAGAMDVFVFPSLHEGLGLALVEAQAAGLPCVLSTVVPAEADQVPGLTRRLSLSRPAAEWAEAVLAARGTEVDRTAALARVREGAFNIEHGLRELTRLYARETGRDGGGGA